MNKQMSREIKLGAKSHKLIFGRLSDLGSEMSKAGLKGKALILTHPRIMRLHGKALLKGLKNFNTSVCEISEGEKSKSETGLAHIYESCNKNKVERTDSIVCFGGGVVGDLGGYAASNWSRGMNVVQVPTTLIAQVDSSIGGKTGIDWHRIKNKIGAFKQPRLIFTDTSVLSTLSDRQFKNGMAEVVKYGVINKKIWLMLVHREYILARNAKKLNELIWSCANLKCDVIEKDEFDLQDHRAKLNLGHTVGHSIEGASNFKLLHGEAVALGLIAAAKLSVMKLRFESNILSDTLIYVLKLYGLPTKLKSIDKSKIIELMLRDKKVKDGKLRFVLIKEIGNVTFPNEVSVKEVKKVLD